MGKSKRKWSVLKNKAALLYENSDFNDAKMAYVDLLRDIPKNLISVEMLFNLGDCYLHLEQFEKAKELAEKCIALNRKSFKGFKLRGKVHFQLKKDELAKRDFERALELNEKDMDLVNKMDMVNISLNAANVPKYSTAMSKKNKKGKKRKKRNVNQVQCCNIVTTTFSKGKDVADRHPSLEYKPKNEVINGLQNSKETTSRPSRQKQYETIQVFLKQSMDADFVAGDKRYLIGYKWWCHWEKHVENDETPPPGKINNAPLLINRCSTSENNVAQLLQPKLQQDYHYKVIPEEAWYALVQWYGGEPAICRYIANDGHLKLYPACPDENMQTPQNSSVKQDQDSKFCVVCAAPRAKLCKACKFELYCGKQCQKSHWMYHKHYCVKKIKNTSSRGGIVGLSNLGNTCFLNAALQCLSHTPILTKYFLNDQFKEDVNQDNPLGTGGYLANAYGALLKDMWFGSKATIAPTTIKRAISKFASQFSGFQQHDSQELIAFLLDGLHEDLNRVHDKPYVEACEANGRPDAIVANESWKRHQLRNQSIFVDNVQGQFKSNVVCPTCQAVSITFDPFNCVQLEIPLKTTRDIYVKFIPLNKANGSTTFAKPITYVLQLEKFGTTRSIKVELENLTGVLLENMIVTDVYSGVIYENLSDIRKLSQIRDDDNIVVYEVYDEPDSIVAFLCHQSTDSKYVADPALIMIRLKTDTLASVTQTAAFTLQQYANVDLKNDEHVQIFSQHVAAMLSLKNDSRSMDVTVTAGRLCEFKGSTLFSKFASVDSRAVLFTVHWNAFNGQYYNLNLLREHRQDASALQVNVGQSRDLTLDDCFQKFTKPESLDAENLWYCAKCKDHRRATKELNIWKLPEILILSLKRFEYRNTMFRDKIDALIDFPIDGLDMRKYCLHQEKSTIYDLYAVNNHFGRMGYGHYTAYARALGKEWFNFDDGQVSKIASDEIVSGAAYMLFYKRRHED